MFFKGAEVVCTHLSKDLRYHLLFLYGAGVGILSSGNSRTECGYCSGHVGCFGLNTERIGGKCVLLNLVNISLKAR